MSEIQRYRIVVDGSPFPRVASDSKGELCFHSDVLALEQQLKTARELLREYRRSRFDHATCTAPNRCDLCCRTDAYLEK